MLRQLCRVTCSTIDKIVLSPAWICNYIGFFEHSEGVFRAHVLQNIFDCRFPRANPWHQNMYTLRANNNYIHLRL